MARLILQLGSALVVPFRALRRPSSDWRSRSFAEAGINVSSRRLNRCPNRSGSADLRADWSVVSRQPLTVAIGGAR